jgi:redox-sensing transcriptional repressor
MRYHRLLTDAQRGVAPSVTSASIGAALDIDPTQVRRDLGTIGLRGIGRVGFQRAEVVRAIREVLDFDEREDAILVGAGHLGSALVAYRGFAQYGLHIVAAFDNDRAKVGTDLAGCPVRHSKGMRAYIERHGIRLAILTTPASVAQKVADRLAAAGIEAIWSFSPRRLVVPPTVFVRNEHISLGIAQLRYHLKRQAP